MVNANGVRKKGRFFWEKAGAPLRWARVDNFFFFISYTLGAFYSIFEGGSTFFVISLLWVLFPGGSHFFVSLGLFDLGYLCFFIGS